jgi:ubiquinone/menaquinone biosynthesis C-methylase UbiE
MYRIKRNKLVPALGYDLLTPFYDPVVAWLMPELKLKNRLIRDACLHEKHRVLDIGCGTGTLAILTKQGHPEVAMIGLDGDAKILQIAQRKIERSSIEIDLTEALAYEQPFADAVFDRVLSSMVFHHLTDDDKRTSLREIRRVLRSNGEVHLADFRRGNKSLKKMLIEAEFENVEERNGYMTLFGRVLFWSGTKHQSS